MVKSTGTQNDRYIQVQAGNGYISKIQYFVAYIRKYVEFSENNENFRMQKNLETRSECQGIIVNFQALTGLYLGPKE